MKILMVCLGNICRSPLAEGIMKHKIAELGLDWQVDSAGTGNWHAGDLPDHRSIATGLTHGVDIRDQRARQIKVSDFEYFDLILAMDENNLLNIRSLTKDNVLQNKVKTILSYLKNPKVINVPDPYYGTQKDFEEVYKLLDEACDSVLKSIQKG